MPPCDFRYHHDVSNNTNDRLLGDVGRNIVDISFLVNSFLDSKLEIQSTMLGTICRRILPLPCIHFYIVHGRIVTLNSVLQQRES